MICRVNKRTHLSTTHDYYIGRGSPLGNEWDWRTPTTAKHRCANRAEAISNYKTWISERIEAKDVEVCAALNEIYQMAKYGDVNLVCYCGTELACHGDIIKEIVEEKLPTRKELTAEPRNVE